ncbi:uncharacterized protein [Macrobrachium rosenbergii]|uniref:uncharacterized protein n=1 Tax=Macrobrachium rosenbergii TaxID=79674 RepID=UPI0034D75245
MTLNFLVHVGAVSFGFLTEFGEGHCFAMPLHPEDARCGGRFRPHRQCIVRRGMPPLPDIVVSNTPPASPIRSATSCPYFCFPEPSKSPKVSCEGHPVPRGHLSPDEGGIVTPPSTPSAGGSSEDEGANGFRRALGSSVIQGALGREVLRRDSCHFHRPHHRRCHLHREYPRRPCRSAAHALYQVPWGRPMEEPCQRLRQVEEGAHCLRCLEFWGRPMEEPRRCLRQVEGAPCLRCLEFTRSREERRLWKGVGHDLRKLADHFQEVHSEMERKDEKSWLTLSLLIPVALTRCLSSSILCLVRWRIFNRLQ